MGSRANRHAAGQGGRLMRVMIVATWLVMVFAVQLTLDSLPVAAHTGFERSEPADGDQLSEPVSEVVITFTGDAAPTGEGFVALDPVRGVRTPETVVAQSESQWLLGFDPPLSGGEVAVRWTVKAPDAHAISGGFSFTVTAAAQPDEPDELDPVSETTVGSANVSEREQETAASERVTDDDGAEPAQMQGGDQGEADDALVGRLGDEPPGDTGDKPMPPDASRAIVSQVVEPVNNAADFATAGADQLGKAELVADVGRGLGYTGAVLAIGALIFAMFVLDRPGDIVAMARWAGTCGLLVVCGAVLESVAQTYLDRGQWSVPDLLAVAETEPGYAVGLRIMAGALLWALPMPRLVRRNKVAPTPARQPVMVSMPDGGSGSPSAVSTKSADRDTDDAVVDRTVPPAVAWRSGPAAAVAIIASVMLAASHVFDGHTLSKGNRILMSLAAFAHVGAAAAWAGGVVALVIVVLRRRRRPPINGAELGARFFVVAAAGLVVVGVVGVALTAMIIDTPSQLWSTDWGRLLLVKVALVVAGAALGGYNHFVLLPRLGNSAAATDRGSSSPRTGFPTVLAVEAVLLIAVAALSGVLVGAAL